MNALLRHRRAELTRAVRCDVGAWWMSRPCMLASVRGSVVVSSALPYLCGTKFFDLEQLEAALSPDMTNVTDSVMTVWVLRSMKDLK